MYGKNWNQVHKHVGTRTSAQTRSHAQKYFNKLARKGTTEAKEELLKFQKKPNNKKCMNVEESTLDNSSQSNVKIMGRASLPLQKNLDEKKNLKSSTSFQSPE